MEGPDDIVVVTDAEGYFDYDLYQWINGKEDSQ